MLRRAVTLAVFALVLTGCARVWAWSPYPEIPLKEQKVWAPIKVYYDLPDPYDDSARMGFGLWERATGCHLWRETPVPEAADVWVTYRPERSRSIATVSWQRERAVVVYKRPGSITQAYNAMVHEAGHVLGLPHDPWPRSFMHWDLVVDNSPWVCDGRFCSDPVDNYELHDQAVRAVKERYCP